MGHFKSFFKCHKEILRSAQPPSHVCDFLFPVFLNKSYIWEKSCSWDIDQNDVSQTDGRIFKWSISPEQIDETASFLACWYKFTKIKSWFEIFWLGVVNGYGQSGLWTLDFLHAGTNSCKLKGNWKLLGLPWSRMSVASHVTCF